MVTLNDCMGNLFCLRVLHVSDVDLVELPESFCHLKHLRYLRLKCMSISTIPQGIRDLKFLQVIDLGGCANLSQLPDSILKLEKLRFISFIGTKIISIPHGFRRLEDLVKLVGFPTHSNVSSDGWWSLEELGSLSKLKNLCVYRSLEKAPSGSVAARAELSSKLHLERLELEFTSRLADNGKVEEHVSEEDQERVEDVLGNLCPPPSLEMLTIRGYIGHRLSQWMRMMSVFASLRRLDLFDYMCCGQLPNGLGQLPFLDYFMVQRAPSINCIGHGLLVPSSGGDGFGMDKTLTPVGREIVDRRQRHHLSRCAGVAFLKLNKLIFEGMLGWREWEWEEQVLAMPVLGVLIIENCKLSTMRDN